MSRCIFKLFGLGAALVFLVLAAASNNAITSAAGTQPLPGKGTVYITKIASAPDGAILKPLDLGLSILTPSCQRFIRSFRPPLWPRWTLVCH